MKVQEEQQAAVNQDVEFSLKVFRYAVSQSSSEARTGFVKRRMVWALSIQIFPGTFFAPEKRQRQHVRQFSTTALKQ